MFLLCIYFDSPHLTFYRKFTSPWPWFVIQVCEPCILLDWPRSYENRIPQPLGLRARRNFCSFDSEISPSAFQVTRNDLVLRLHCWLFKSCCSSGTSILWFGAHYVGYTILLIFLTRPFWTNHTHRRYFIFFFPPRRRFIAALGRVITSPFYL